MTHKLLNPATVHAPMGAYSHAVAVPAGTETLFISGQVGARPDGSHPATVGEQADQALANIVAILAANAMGVEHIVKLTTYVVAGQPIADVRAARLKYLGDHKPASTAVYVAALVAPEWLVEIEAVAAK